jgi:ribonuclease T1
MSGSWGARTPASCREGGRNLSGSADPRRLRTAAAVGAVVLFALVLVGLLVRPSGTDAPAADASTPTSGLSAVVVADLPAEARATLTLIAEGGPYPYAKDGAVFGNIEGLLPARPRGYYHEYTVPTPGSADRGARRLVAVGDGDVYWTDDHYETFRQVRR